MLSASQVREDVAFLRAGLEKWHPNLYLYSGKTEVDTFFDRLYRTLPETMTEREAYGLIATAGSVIRDGHTLFFPSEASTGYHNMHDGFFPFKTWWNGKSLYVALNYSKTQVIPDGAEIISINGVAAAGIMDFCLKGMMHDGENRSYPVWVLNNWFMEYYSYFYGHPDSFAITYLLPDGTIDSKTVKALTKQEIFANREKNYPHIKFGRKEKDGLLLEINKELKTSILTIKDFHNDILKKEYKQNFKKTINRYFNLIGKSGSEYLILDIRNNQGGAVRYGKILLSHLMNTPFRLVEAYYKVNRSAAADPGKRIKKCNGPATRTFRPRSDAFRGKLYILVNGGSFSNSGIVASALEHYGRGVFIGEETGGNKHVLCGSVKYIKLPNTGINVEIPTLRFVIRDQQKNMGHGLIPEHLVRPDIEDIIQNKDVVKEYALGLIRADKGR